MGTTGTAGIRCRKDRDERKRVTTESDNLDAVRPDSNDNEVLETIDCINRAIANLKTDIPELVRKAVLDILKERKPQAKGRGRVPLMSEINDIPDLQREIILRIKRIPHSRTLARILDLV